VDDASLLRKSELFQAFEPDDMASIVGSALRTTLQRGDVVFGEGDAADQMFVVRSGRVAISKRSPEGKESIVALMEPGDLFGEMSLFDGEHRSAGARALEPSELVVVPYAPLSRVFRDRPALLWPMVALLCRRMRVTDAALADSLFLDVTGRTAKRLLELAGGADEFALPITQEELAGMVGASRERVNKALAQFIRLGWLAVNDRRYRILRRDDLVRRAR
jgi:CRP/FNR family transcriptional regulator, cyclic AMP receptor protein